MTKEEIENYFVESAGYGRDKVRNFMDVINKALEQKDERTEELERKLEQAEKDLADYQFNYPTIKELQKENAELRKEWQEQVQKATDEGNARTLQTIQLSKAKEHIRTLISCLIDWVQEGDKYYCYITEAEQFLSEVEK